MKYTATLSAVQVGQAVKSLLLLGERKITIEETEKDRFVVIFDPNIKQVNGDPDKGDTWL